ncbi:hypothetical protein [Trichlorobacter thiogenes]|uniref:hypothetical protein n=1 Tax=Trichlorobacter thiogenes TaxID=115783 RepID=UPI001428AAAF|nr:hypothetical protein [Trichlorobacter thiogenes]
MRGPAGRLDRKRSLKTLKRCKTDYSDHKKLVRRQRQDKYTVLEISPKVKVPMEDGDKGLAPEPFNRYYPKYGNGGYHQLVPKNRITVNFDKIDMLPEK